MSCIADVVNEDGSYRADMPNVLQRLNEMIDRTIAEVEGVMSARVHDVEAMKQKLRVMNEKISAQGLALKIDATRVSAWNKRGHRERRPSGSDSPSGDLILKLPAL